MTILTWGIPERRGQKAQSARAPKSDHHGKTGHDKLVARMGLYPKDKFAGKFTHS